MNIIIKPSNLFGSIRVPSSKSMTHRALTLSAISDGVSIIKNPLTAEDTDATERVLVNLGIKIDKKDKEWKVTGGELHSSKKPLDCGESGTTLRIMTAVSSLVKGETTLIGGPSLSKRPIGPLTDALKMIGVEASCHLGYPPTKIHSSGVINGGKTIIPGNISSQFISALLIISPLAQKPIIIDVTTPLESKPYVSMTLSAMEKFGVTCQASSDLKYFETPLKKYKPTKIDVEGDWSSAAYMLVAGALSGEVYVTGLNMESGQSDASILDILKLMGADVNFSKDFVKVTKSHLINLNYDLSDCPDLFPVVAALCATAKGTSKLTGLERLKLKESDRLEVMINGLMKMGVDVEANSNFCLIKSSEVKGTEIDSYNDHRIAMAFATLSLVGKGETKIQNAESVKKSYPNFWTDFRKLGAQLKGDDL